MSELTTTLAGTASKAAWRDNPAWTQLLGLCPLLAVSTSVANALGLAAASSFVLMGSSLLISASKSIIAPHLRLPAYVLIIATFTTCAVLLMQAFAFALYERIALFVQIIVTNCMILGRAEAFAARSSILQSFADALGTALGFAVAIVTLGAVRELLGAGTLFAGTQDLLGAFGSSRGITLLPEGARLGILRTPPGAFLAAGVLLAIGQWLFATSRDSTEVNSTEMNSNHETSDPENEQRKTHKDF